MTSPSMIRDVLSDRRGVVAPVTAVVFAVLLGMVGLVTDAGVWFAAKRDLQAATDAAALGSARYASLGTGAVESRAQVILAANNRATGDLVRTQVGYYCPSAVTGAVQFSATRCPGPASSLVTDAVRLTTQTTGAIIFSRLFTDNSVPNRPIRVTSTAALINEAGLRAGSGLLNVDIARSFLSALAGGNVDLISYQGLANADLKVLPFLDQLAISAGVTAGTYQQLLDSTVSVSSILQAAAAVAAQNSQIAGVSVASDLGTIRARIQGNPRLRLGDLIDLGVWRDLPVGSGTTGTAALNAGINAYQLATASLQVANGSNFVRLNLNTGAALSPVANVSLGTTVIEKPQEPPFGFGPEGTSVNTAQVRTKLSLNLLSGSVQLPLYIAIASGQATISDIDCPDTPFSGIAAPADEGNATVRIAAQTATADVFIGTVADTAMQDFSGNLTPTHAPIIGVADSLSQSQLLSILNLGQILSGILPTVKGLAHINLGRGQGSLLFDKPSTNISSYSRPFSSHGYIGRPATDTSSGSLAVPATLDAGAPKISQLLTSLDLQLCVGSSCSNALSSILSSVTGLLQPLLVAVDNLLYPLLSQLLGALGVQLGYMDVFVTGARCGIPVLVE